jgi:hypothetical protein
MQSYRKECAQLATAWNKLLDGVPSDLAEVLRHNAFLAGGCVASVLQGEEPQDYDIYFYSKDHALQAAKLLGAKFAYNKWPESDNFPAIIKYTETAMGVRQEIYHACGGGRLGFISQAADKEFDPVFWSDHTITLDGGYQIVLAFTGQPGLVVNDFDYIHCAAYYLPVANRLGFRDKAATLHALLQKRLIYTGSEYPVASLIRSKKFMRRGYSFNAGQMLKVMFNINQLDLTDPKVLRDQLVGVDVLYFMELLDKVNKKGTDSPLDIGTIWTEIDAIFD